jgi:hypothetical protein
MEELILFVVFGAILIVGVWTLFWPAHVVAFRERRGWNDWTGRMLYGTPLRARVTGIFLLAVVLAEVIGA